MGYSAVMNRVTFIHKYQQVQAASHIFIVPSIQVMQNCCAKLWHSEDNSETASAQDHFWNLFLLLKQRLQLPSNVSSISHFVGATHMTGFFFCPSIDTRIFTNDNCRCLGMALAFTQTRFLVNQRFSGSMVILAFLSQLFSFTLRNFILCSFVP